MTVSCVAVARERGEAVRTQLAEAGVLDGDHQIAVDDGTIYLPVTDPAEVPDQLADRVVERDVTTRDRQRTPADVAGATR